MSPDGSIEIQAQTFSSANIADLNMTCSDNPADNDDDGTMTTMTTLSHFNTGSKVSLESTGSVVTNISICAAMTNTAQNMFSGSVESRVLSLSLYDCETGDAVAYTQGKVVLELAPSEAGGFDFPMECRYWDEEDRDWSTDGCVVIESGSESTRCECSHLTSFAAIAPPLTVYIYI